MRLKIIQFLCVCFLKLSCLVFSQDIHLSQINTNVLFQNPSNSGDFQDDFRIISAIRNQWRSVTKPYTTETVSFDFKLKKNKKISIGSVFLNDVSGDGAFRTNEFRFLPAFHHHLSKKSKIKVGIDIGLNYRQLIFNNFKFDNQFDGLQFNESIPSNETYKNQSKLNGTIGFGSAYTYTNLKKMEYTFGLSFYNLNQPNQSFYGNKLNRDIRMHFTTIIQQNLTKRISLSHSINFNIQGVYKETQIGTKINYSLLTSFSNTILSAGTSYRIKDAMIFLIGMKYTSYYLGISYDVNISQLSKASKGKGSSEICFVYSFNRKTPNSKIPIRCYDYY